MVSTRLIVGSILAFFAGSGRWRTGAVLCIFSLLLTSCTEIRKPSSDPFISETTPPKKQEFRWSNGKAVKSLDPALAVAPPETDVVRGMFEGLADLDPKSLEEIPAAAEKWTSSDGFRTWTFTLRKNLKWSSGAVVTAGDFVRSWKRLAIISAGGNADLLTDNILGMRELRNLSSRSGPPLPASQQNDEVATGPENANTTRLTLRQEDVDLTEQRREAKKVSQFGVKALDDLTLEVTLVNPDKDFPKLVAHPMFFPVARESDFTRGNPAELITNGPFRVISSDQNGVTLSRSDQYWNSKSIGLEEVRFVPYSSAESALQAYRSGEIDALTNAEFEPLALKLLTPFKDFRQTVHNALNFYEFNLGQPPFTDRRVREALTVALERDRLTEGEMKGSTESALHLFPFDTSSESLFDEDRDSARKLLAEAGFPNGESFPVVRLVINRNDTQLRIARSVAKMWKANLNIDTDVITRENSEMESIRAAGEFDLIRRGLVFPTVDRHTSMAAIFLPKPDRLLGEVEFLEPTAGGVNANISVGANNAAKSAPRLPLRSRIESDPAVLESTLEDAVYEFRVVPLYFPVSYSMVKPYVLGFDINGLDAPSLKTVRINSEWQPNAQ